MYVLQDKLACTLGFNQDEAANFEMMMDLLFRNTPSAVDLPSMLSITQRPTRALPSVKLAELPKELQDLHGFAKKAGEPIPPLPTLLLRFK